jgi:hypothetical protein
VLRTASNSKGSTRTTADGRFEARLEDGGWIVFDSLTGKPARIGNGIRRGLTERRALAWAVRLNENAAKFEREPMFQPGDRVRLSELGRERCPRYPDRAGTVTSYCRGPNALRVLFDGRKTGVMIHASYLEQS